MTAEFHVWKVSNPVINDERHALVVDTINNLDDQVDFDISAQAEEPDVPFENGHDSWEKYLLDDLVPHVVDEYGCPGDKEYHMLIIDNSNFNPGAGYTYGTMNDAGGADPFKNNSDCDDSLAAVGGVNAAVIYYENSAGPYGHHGKKAFKATVIHNVIHGITYHKKSTPADDCSDSHSDDHSLGKIADIDDDDNDEAVTPAQMWYTSDYLSGNSPPCDNCDSEPDQNCNNIRLEISSCTQSNLNSSADELNL